mmetsp:Transcript_9509/g.31055  ORF Transcript_9509/g.31055 Transcript_9509/m.31055 type:complete len:382 (-) Transcript_9509:138-1283(-)
MGDDSSPSRLLTTSTVAGYVEGLRMLGSGDDEFVASEISGGNLNYTWRVLRGNRSVFVKQAPDFIKCLGSDFSLTRTRLQREVEALRAFHAVSKEHSPAIYHFDADRCVFVAEDLRGGYALLRDQLIDGTIRREVATDLGAFLKRLRHMEEAPPKIIGDDNNAAMRAITRDYVFTKPFCPDDATNRKLMKGSPLFEKAKAFRSNANVLAAIRKTRDEVFDGKRECLCHGDLHCGSVMTNGERNVLIDAEFAFVGPAAMDAAFLIAGYCFAYGTAVFWAKNADDAALRRYATKLAIADLLGDDDLLNVEDVAAVAACELARRVLGAASVPDLADLTPAHRDYADIFVLDLASSLLLRPPATPDAFLAALDDTFDASLLFTAA